MNKSLKKELFDCSKIGDFYDCGCVEDEQSETRGKEKVGKAFGQDSGSMSIKEEGKNGQGRIDLRVEEMGEVAGG